MHDPHELRSKVIFCCGAQAAEQRLFEEIDGLLARDLEGLSSPVRIVVPSRSLRQHILRVLSHRRGAVVGIQIQTLFGLALDVVTRSGIASPRADAGFELTVRRLAAGEPILNASLNELTDGYDAVVGAVRDLLDAGFLPGHEDGVLERLDDVRGEVAAERLGRSAALVRLAAAAYEAAEVLDLRRSMRALQLAEDALQTGGCEVLPTRALVVYGFADVTGVAADLLSALVRVLGARVILDRPPDPAMPASPDLGGEYLTRLEERLAHLERVIDTREVKTTNVELAEAPDAEAEARWVAERIRDLIDGGIEAESIGVVGRGLENQALHLRRHFRRLGVPFSGAGAVVPGAGPRRRLRRLTEMLRRGPSAPLDLWIEARADKAGATELMLGLRVLGVLRLADLATLPGDTVSPRGIRLPVAIGPEEEFEGDGGATRRLSSAAFRHAANEASRLVSVLDGRPSEASAAAHRRHTMVVLSALGWDEETPEWSAVRDALDGLCRELPPAFELSRSEWLKLLGDRLDGIGEVPLGGRGAGVQILTVMESRARTFGHLYIVGVNRGVFPRVGHEDPMLPEAVRVRLAADVLPEMPVKGRSADEERYLFAQLMSSAPTVSVSWHVFGSEGTVTPSPFVDRLLDREGVGEPTPIAQLWSGGGSDSRPRTAYELAVLTASQAGTDKYVSTILEAAVAEGRADSPPLPQTVPPDELAAARVDVLRAIERPVSAEGPGPWYGFSGAGSVSDEDPLWVTHAESIGTCPWRAFVQRRLGVEPMPDPLLGLPGIDGPLVGQVVHGVLEAIVVEALEKGGELAEVMTRDALRVGWPSIDRFREMVDQVAGLVAAREGLGPVGMAPLLSARAREFLAVERDLEWGTGSLASVRGCEVEGWACVSGVAGKLMFRADRVDGPDADAVLIDYKAAKPAVEASTEPYRSNNIYDRVARGRMLQAAAYSRAEGVGGAIGRYLYLKPKDDCKDEIRELEIAGDDSGVIEAFEAAIRAIAEARAQGVAFPRVEEANGTTADHCGYCAVAEACRRDDSAFRRDLVVWFRGSEGSGDTAVDAARNLWWLGVERPEGAQ